MKRYLLYCICSLFLAAIHTRGIAVPSMHTQSSGNLCLIENKGQVTDQHHNPRPDIHFKIVAVNGLNIFIGAGKIHYQWAKTVDSGKLKMDDDPSFLTPHSSSLIMYRMDVSLVNGNQAAEIILEDKQPFYEQYYTHLTGENGIRAHRYKKITYREVYPNIDWVFYINPQGKVEHDFVIRPGGKVSDIRLQYAGATEMRLNHDGSVTATTPFGSVTENTPYCYQQDGQQVAGRFLLNNNTLSFATAAYQGTLTIDPVLEWGTYFGGAEDEEGKALATGKDGNTYLAGWSLSTANMVTTGAYQSVYGGSAQLPGGDAFLAKFNAAGQCLWATYYGGTEADQGTAVTTDTAGNVYLAGWTRSTTAIATVGSHQDSYGGGTGDGFLASFDGNGQRRWATYYGGTGIDRIQAVCAGLYGDVYIGGYTRSNSAIATAGTHQSAISSTSSDEGFVARFSNTGILLWGTYYGGSAIDRVLAVAADADSNLYLAGYTRSTANIASPGSHQAAWRANDDAFLARLDASGHRAWGTYYGGGQLDQANALALDGAGYLYLAGTTKSTDSIATPGSHQPAFAGGQDDGFVARFDTAGVRQWGTYYGGEYSDGCYGIHPDRQGHLYVSGSTASLQQIATPGVIMDTLYMYAAMLIKMDSTGQRLWGTYIGGDDIDFCYAMSGDNAGNIYLAGQTYSTTGLATPGSHQPLYNGGGSGDAWLVRISDCPALLPPGTITGNLLVCRDAGYTYSVPSQSGVISYTWTLPQGWSGAGSSDTINIRTGLTGGPDTIRVAANYLCGSSDEKKLAVTVAHPASITPPGSHDRCTGDTLFLHAGTQPGATWQWLADGADIPGVTDSIHGAYKSGAYRVVTQINGQCTDTAGPVILTVHPLPQPVISAKGNELSTGIYVSYQWSRDGRDIAGAIAPTYIMPVLNGRYAVTVTDTNGCANTSAGYDPSVGIRDAETDGISIYPNPATDHLIVTAPVPVTITISSMDGKAMIRLPGIGQADLTTLAPGIYIVSVRDRQGMILKTEKLVRQ